MDCALADRAFGPQVAATCRVFDFSRLFEEAFMSIAPSAAFLLLAVVQAGRLRVSRPVVSRTGWLSVAKPLTIALLAVAELIKLSAWATSMNQATSATLPASILALVVPLALLGLSHLEHVKTIRPSSIICTYLFFTLLFDMAQLRTIWTSNLGHLLQAICSACFAFKVILLALEAQPKVSWIQSGTKHFSPEETTSVFGRRLFLWLNRLFLNGYRKALTLGDLFVLDQAMSATVLRTKLENAWARRSQSSVGGSSHRRGHRFRSSFKDHQLLFALGDAFKWPLLQTVLPRLLMGAFMYAQPFLIERVTLYLEPASEEPKHIGYGLIGAYALVYSGIAISNSWYWHQQYRTITMIRGALVSIVYAKTLRTESSQLADARATTLMSADVERISVGLRGIQEVWASPVELIVGLYLLYRQIGLAMFAFAGLAIVIATAATTTATYAASRQSKWMNAMQSRIASIVKTISAIKSIKMLGFEHRVFEQTMAMRQNEMDAFVYLRRCTATVTILSFAQNLMAPAVALLAFLPISQSSRLPFTTQRIFGTLTIIQLITEPLQALLQYTPQILTSLGCMTRIQSHLELPNHKDPRVHFEREDQSIDFKLQGCNLGWNASRPVLKDLDLHIPSMQMTLIAGAVGSGKSTLLNAMLGEQLLSGAVMFSGREIAYCSQKPWLSNTTVRDAITGHSEVDMAWYETVVDACALREDVSNMKLGDQTLIGSGGAALSGGQKQRVSLARAVYSRKPIVILDDVFSGLDKSTSDSISHALFSETGLLRRATQCTVVLVTHDLRHIKYAQHVVLLSDGQAVQGTPGSHAKLSALLEQFSSEVAEEGADADAGPAKPSARATKTSNDSNEATEVNATSDRSALGYYLKSMGLANTIFSFSMAIVLTFFWKFSIYWAQLWAQHSTTQPFTRDAYYAGVYTLFNGLGILLAAVWFCHVMFVIVPKSGITLHETLLQTTLKATFPHISRIDTGQLTTRFGQDLLLIDTELVIAFINTVLDGLAFLAQVALIAAASVYLLAVLPLLALIVYCLQRFYLRTSRRIRHLDLEAKAPLYAQFTDLLEGVATIRSFGWQRHALEANSGALNASQRPFYLLFSIQRWLECVLNFLVAGLAVVVLGIAVGVGRQVGSASIGVALLNIVSMSEALKSMISYWTQLETSLAAIARIRSFSLQTPQETHANLEGHQKKQDPGDETMAMELRDMGAGSIEFHDATAVYNPLAPPVISSLSLSIQPGEKVALCGRSGSGKSTLLNAMLGMVSISKGQLLINGKPSGTMASDELRQCYQTIPQEPYFFPGTIRENMDRSGHATDEKVLDRLRRCGLAAKIDEVGGLDSPLVVAGFSAGELQLLSLARAMLHTTGILLLDEATSNVDWETDARMHDIIFDEFAGQTIVEVLHRREHLHRFDRVVLMEGGRLVDVSAPSKVDTSRAFES